jgi:uncharacterized protein
LGTRYDRAFREIPAFDVTKILFFALIGIVVYLLLKKKRSVHKPSRSVPPSSSSAQASAASPEPMVSCAYCGLHIPTSESLKIEGRHYCGEEHRRLDVGSPHR